MEAALQQVLQKIQRGTGGVQDDAEEELAIKLIWQTASLSQDHLTEVTHTLWAVLLQVIHAPVVRIYMLYLEAGVRVTQSHSFGP